MWFESNPAAVISFAVALAALAAGIVTAVLMAGRRFAFGRHASSLVAGFRSDAMDELVFAAGLSSPWSRLSFVLVRMFGAIGFAAVGWVAADLVLDAGKLGLTCAVLAVIAGAVGWSSPRVVLRFLAAGRQTRMDARLEDATSVLLLASEAGLTLPEAFAFSAEMLEGAEPEVADVLADAARSLKASDDRNAVLLDLSKQTGSPRPAALVASLAQMLRYGTPILAALRALTNEIHQARLLLIEKQAERIPRRVALALVLFSLPCMVFTASFLLSA